MRRAIRHGKMLGIEGPFLDLDLSSVVDLMRGDYPELMETRNFVSKVIRNEEERFSETLDSGLKILREELERMKTEGRKTLSGEVVFRLYDTFGFPPDLTEEILREEGLGYDEAEFQLQMEGQRQKAVLAGKAGEGQRSSPV
jgi:alanyl-tRNA synthetase